MNILSIILFAICICCYTGQAFFNRLYSDAYEGPKAAATPVFTIVYGAMVAVITLLLGSLKVEASTGTLIYGAANGIVLFLYYLGMIQAARRGPYSFQSIVMSMGSTVICIFASCVLFGDTIRLIKYIGIGIMLLSFIVLNFGGLDFSDIKKGYYFWTFSLFFTNGIFGVLLDAQQRAYPEERSGMLIMTFASCAVFSFIYLLIVQKHDVASTFKMSKKAWGFALASSTCAAFAVYLLMILLRTIPSYILYTINNGTVLVAGQILAAAVLKEKMSKQAVIGIILATTSIVVLSI